MKPYSWVAKGDVNAFFGLMLDNLTNLVILSGLLIGVFNFPTDIVFFKMIPGTAIGILCGNIMYTYIAYRLMKKTGRNDITAMPLGVDTVSLFGLMHSPHANGELFLPWNVTDKTPLYLSVSYLILSVLSLCSVKLKKE